MAHPAGTAPAAAPRSGTPSRPTWRVTLNRPRRSVASSPYQDVLDAGMGSARGRRCPAAANATRRGEPRDAQHAGRLRRGVQENSA